MKEENSNLTNNKNLFQPKLKVEDFLELDQMKIKDLICFLCKGVFFEPILISNGKCFCKECFYNFNKNNQDINKEDIFLKNKYFCTLTYEEIEKNRIKEISVLKDKIDNLHIYCSNKHLFCNWVGLVKEKENHLKNCLKDDFNK